jgi:hypothetical protein
LDPASWVPQKIGLLRGGEEKRKNSGCKKIKSQLTRPELPERLALNSCLHISLRGTVLFSSLASDHVGSLLYDGGGLLRADKYHTKKVCQYDHIQRVRILVTDNNPVSAACCDTALSKRTAKWKCCKHRRCADIINEFPSAPVSHRILS